MDPTTQAFLAALLGAAVAGSAVLAWAISERQQQRRLPVTDEPVVPAAVATVLSVLRSSGLRLPERLTATLEVESGANDPMAIFLTLGLRSTHMQTDWDESPFGAWIFPRPEIER